MTDIKDIYFLIIYQREKTATNNEITFNKKAIIHNIYSEKVEKDKNHFEFMIVFRYVPKEEKNETKINFKIDKEEHTIKFENKGKTFIYDVSLTKNTYNSSSSPAIDNIFSSSSSLDISVLTVGSTKLVNIQGCLIIPEYTTGFPSTCNVVTGINFPVNRKFRKHLVRTAKGGVSDGYLTMDNSGSKLTLLDVTVDGTEGDEIYFDVTYAV